MQKQVLGKSVGRLLDSTKPLAEPANQTDSKLDLDKLSSPGLKVLVASSSSLPLNPENAAQIDNKIAVEGNKSLPTNNPSKIPLWFLFIADVILVGMAFVLIIGKSKPITKLEIVISASAIIIGGTLTCWGIVIRKNKE